MSISSYSVWRKYRVFIDFVDTHNESLDSVNTSNNEIFTDTYSPCPHQIGYVPLSDYLAGLDVTMNLGESNFKHSWVLGASRVLNGGDDGIMGILFSVKRCISA